MGGKLGNKGRRKGKIAFASFNILFISEHFGLQKAKPHLGVLVSGKFVFIFLVCILREKVSFSSDFS